MWVERGLLAGFLATSALYFTLDPREPRFVPWILIYSLQFALYAALAWRSRARRHSLSAVITVAIACRMLLWFTDPVLEADYWRYLWDGHVTASGVNPYLHPPEAPELDPLETDYRFFVTWSHIRTIYPPLAQYAFLLSHTIAPDSLLGLKVLLTLFDILTGVLLTRFRPDAAFLYWLNPLVLKEVANSAHIDALPMLLTTLAVIGMCRGSRKQGAWVALALGAAAKLYALLLVPLFARLDPDWKRHGLVAALVLTGLYLPFASAGSLLFDGTRAFAEQWVFNASLFRILDTLGAVPAKPVAAVALLAIVAWRAWALRDREALPRETLVVVAALLLLSPVVNAWYLLWILPFAVVTRNPPFLTFTYLVGFAYAWFQDAGNADYYRLFEYGIFYALLLLGESTMVWRHHALVTVRRPT